MTLARHRLASALLAWVSLGLLLSLLPRTSFVARSAGDIVDAVGPVWPEQSVEQVLDDGLGIVSEIRIWGAAGADRGEEALAVAALLQGPDRELVRQARVGIKASHLLEPYVLEFAPYRPAPGETLILRLWVTDEQRNHAIFGTTEPGDDGGGPTLNLNPTDQGPLAYEMIWRGEGWRAALEGSGLDLMRLAGGIAAAVVAVFLSPLVSRRLSQALRRSIRFGCSRRRRTHCTSATVGTTGLKEQRSDTKRAPTGRTIYLFPWLIPAFAILHYLATNLHLVRAYEAITVGVVVTVIVTVIFIAMRTILGSAAAAAVFTSLLGIAFFSYGHIYTDNNAPDDRYFLGIFVPIILGAAILLKRIVLTPAVLRFLNLGSVVLLALPTIQILSFVLSASFQPERGGASLTAFPGLEQRITQINATDSPDDMRDIYFIILDEYPRSGSPPSFDNSAFHTELESRGFYVDPNARSNYTRTPWAISAFLNMNHYHPYTHEHQGSHQLYQTGNDHALGRILQSLGYRYIHISSDWYFTDTSPAADMNISFGPNGPIVSESATHDLCFIERILDLPNEFTAEFLRTTMAWRFIRLDARWQTVSCSHNWKQPSFALQWIEFMKNVAVASGPKFVFSHFLKPHSPFSFDRHGNISPDLGGWSPEHDPTVASPYYGQILWLNDRLLEVIDAILKEYDEPPIIVIASDHGSREMGFGHPMATEILAAYLLPDGGESAIYPHITPVNIFRSILNYYFDLQFEMLEDKVYSTFE